jgi:hypothetical protein
LGTPQEHSLEDKVPPQGLEFYMATLKNAPVAQLGATKKTLLHVDLCWQLLSLASNIWAHGQHQVDEQPNKFF